MNNQKRVRLTINELTYRLWKECLKSDEFDMTEQQSDNSIMTSWDCPTDNDTQSDNSIMTSWDCPTDNDTIPKLFGNMSIWYEKKNLTANQTKDVT